jgi:chromosome segregation ATPase
MSQINQLIKQTEALESQYQQLSPILLNLPETLAENEKELENINQKLVTFTKEISDLLIVGAKLSEKLNQVDPDTGAKRYGAQTQQKFLSAFEKLQALNETFMSEIPNWEPFYTEKKEHFHLLNQSKHQIPNLNPVINLEELREKEEQERKAKLEREEREAVLRQQAEVVRKRKQEESVILQDFIQIVRRVISCQFQFC